MRLARALGVWLDLCHQLPSHTVNTSSRAVRRGWPLGSDLDVSQAHCGEGLVRPVRERRGGTCDGPVVGTQALWVPGLAVAIRDVGRMWRRLSMATGLSGTPTPNNSPESLSRPRGAYAAKLVVGAVSFRRWLALLQLLQGGRVWK